MQERERSFLQRNKQVQLRELTDLVAVRRDRARQRAGTESTVPERIAADVPESQVQAFESAGWVFQERSAEGPQEGAPQAKVFVKPGGRLALSTDTLTAQVRGDPSEDEANALLAPYGCRVVERLTFAPGLFRIAVTDLARGDTLDVANQLMESGLVEFAEPELIEVTGHRSS